RFTNVLIYLPLLKLLDKQYCDKTDQTYLCWNKIVKWKNLYFIEFPNVNKVNEDYIQNFLIEQNFDDVKLKLFNKDFTIFDDIQHLKYFYIDKTEWKFDAKLEDNQINKIFQHLYFRYILGIGDSGFHNM